MTLRTKIAIIAKRFKRGIRGKIKPGNELPVFFCAKPFDSRIIAENKSKPLKSILIVEYDLL